MKMSVKTSGSGHSVNFFIELENGPRIKLSAFCGYVDPHSVVRLIDREIPEHMRIVEVEDGEVAANDLLNKKER